MIPLQLCRIWMLAMEARRGHRVFLQAQCEIFSMVRIRQTLLLIMLKEGIRHIPFLLGMRLGCCYELSEMWK